MATKLESTALDQDMDLVGNAIAPSLSGIFSSNPSSFLELMEFQNFPSALTDDLIPSVKTGIPSQAFVGPEAPSTPNENSASISSSETDTVADEAERRRTCAKSKKIKKVQNRQKEPRIAFKTKSDVDFLEDGYKWRKYGQKAVKYSPYPRSYYRCTSTGCSVKKRVERSSEDPSVIIHTYEGKHTHYIPANGFLPRGHLSGQVGFDFRQFERNPSFQGSFSTNDKPLDFSHMSTGSRGVMDGGLLQDLIPFQVKKMKD